MACHSVRLFKTSVSDKGGLGALAKHVTRQRGLEGIGPRRLHNNKEGYHERPEPDQNREPPQALALTDFLFL